ncbi:MAG TPA: serine/threonine-protein kinase, partial [Pseudomonadota bacterium]|nr:serine/threonine-protein kinase [Pseudomonadota bacterium]
MNSPSHPRLAAVRAGGAWSSGAAFRNRSRGSQAADSATGAPTADLEPSNLFLRGGNIEQVTILDFGIARRAMHATSMTRTGLVIGTPEYMAPEQARGQRDIEASADIFSLGCVLFECLTGQPPFVSDVIAGVLATILFEPAPSVRSLQPAIPESIDKLLARMLEKEPSARLQDAGQLLAALAELDSTAISSLRLPKVALERNVSSPAEQQLVSVLLSSVPSLVPSWETDATMTAPADLEPLQELQHELAVYGAKVEILADGSIVTV